MSRLDRQCAATTITGERCPMHGHSAYAVVKRTDRSKPADDPTRVAYFWVCEAHCGSGSNMHETAEPFRRGTT